ncbi:hypothetical protein [Streptomyces sp. NPDC014006]|uniref:hypothetical protein n=1 Tax=Streptomyces sp. NPDC014006 TaxID=3364870 RepID=UPI0036FC0AE8
MAVTQPKAAAVTTTSFGGPMTGYIDPKRGLKTGHDEGGNFHVKFVLMIIAEVEVDDYITTTEKREFTVWAKGKDAQVLADAFPEGFKDVPKARALVTVDPSDIELLNYPVSVIDETTKKEKTVWVREIRVTARSITLPNV